jgi:hypothetical protein
MKFENSDAPVSATQLAAIELALSLTLPNALKSQYLQSNGGSPVPYVYEDENLDTAVARFLPIASLIGARTAVDTYQHLVLHKRIVPKQYFPFAVDGGGDYFFADCSTDEGLVHYYRSDPPGDEGPLISLGLSVGNFWIRLKAE